MESINKAKNWLLNSNVQQKNGEHIGAFNSWYDNEQKNFTFAYPEITGYALTLLTYLYSLEKNPIYLQKAKQAAEWIIKKVVDQDGGCFSCFPYLSSFNKNQGIKYVFDSGMILNGIVNLYREVPDNRYLNSSIKIAEWLQDMQQKDGSFIPFIDKDGIKKQKLETWSTQSGSYLSKVSIGLLNLYDITRNNEIKNMATKSLNNALSFQKSDGRFKTYNNYNSSNFHPHCYSAEAMLTAGLFLEIKDYLNSATNATKYILENLSLDDEVPRHYMENKFNYNERSDIIAQVLRLAVLLKYLGLLESSKEIQKIYNRLLLYQEKTNGHEGSFVFGKRSDGSIANNANSWCTMFALQALILHNNILTNKLEFNWRYLV